MNGLYNIAFENLALGSIIENVSISGQVSRPEWLASRQTEQLLKKSLGRVTEER